ncbi:MULTISPECIES: choice-of-anchor J domain-containing protein [unclassified Chryseobacterium]|uniref:T9SS-dependent choice-of-anchor J family protein n=1 Tax=unclassified Chryseobacterium TaxID=2593645 RepID=UPI000F45AF1A|nr:choice-of-anchor J domain-containing protein [Chryseobacterium sp. G0240]ROI05607.1 T9SS C-terminal target domain-containing protein [Chryseobacterium sp. G0240]
MKKNLFFTGVIFLFTVLSIKGQTVIFEETFDFPNGPNGWETIDRDGDGNEWTDIDDPGTTDPWGFSGKIVFSSSFTYNGQSYNPDNLLVSPAINLPTGNPATLTFLIGGYKEDMVNPDPHEHYAVYVLPEGSAFQGTETPLLEETLPNAGVAFTKTISLAAFAGQTVKLYFRHFNSNNQIILILDTVKVTVQGNLGTSETNPGSNPIIYPNPASDYVYLHSGSKITKAEVFDGTGRKMNVVLTGNKIDVKNLLPGNYLITITTGNKTYSQKIIKK